MNGQRFRHLRLPLLVSSSTIIDDAVIMMMLKGEVTLLADLIMDK